MTNPLVMTARAIDRGADRMTGDAGPVGVTVAVDAPAHGQVRNLTHALHRLDRTVASLAHHARGDVRAMVEGDEVGNVVDLVPRNRPLRPCWVALQSIIESQRIVELAQLR